MIRLTWVELRRFFARTLVIAGMLAGVAVAGLTLVTGAASVHPLSESEIAAAEQYYQEAVADWEQHGAEMEASCREQEALEREATGQDVDFGCDQMAPQREWYVPQPPAFGDYLPAILLMLSTLMVLLPLMVGATATAAEHSTGAIGNWLTFEPRRLRVYASKVVAPALGVIPLAVVVVLVTIVGTWWIFDSRGLADGVTAQVWTEIAWSSARLIAAAVAAAAVGAALGFLLRSFAAVLGVVAGYAIAVEGILANLLEWLRPWTVSLNLTAWVNGEASYWVSTCTTDPSGTSCTGVEHTVTMAQGGGYLLALSAVLVVVAAALFHRRDVA